MNVVRSSRSLRGLGDLVDSPLFTDIQTPQTFDASVNDFPMYNDPGLTEAESVSAAQAAQGATSLIPSAGSAIASSIPSAISSLTKGLTPGPSPRVAVPTPSLWASAGQSFFSSPNTPYWILGIAAALYALTYVGEKSGRRR
jgi:hypothetical protein